MGQTSLILTTWNSRPFLDKCLQSLDEIRYRGELIIVDSSSEDGTSHIVPSTARYIRVKNRGWSHAVNRGVRETKNDTLIISNPDIVFNRTLYHLIRIFEALVRLQGHPYSVVSPSLVSENGRLQCYKKLPELIDLFVTETVTGKYSDAILGKPIWKRREQISREGIIDQSELPTASLFVTSKQLLEWYPLDQSLMRGEDWDLWRRMARDKIQTVWTRDASFIHSLGHTAKNYRKGDLRRMELQGILRYADKWNIHPTMLRILFALDKIISLPHSQLLARLP